MRFLYFNTDVRTWALPFNILVMKSITHTAVHCGMLCFNFVFAVSERVHK